MLLEVCHFCPSLNEQCLSSLGRDVCHMLHGDIVWNKTARDQRSGSRVPLGIGAQEAMLLRSSQHSSQPPECFLLHSIVDVPTLTDLSYHQKCPCPPFLNPGKANAQLAVWEGPICSFLTGSLATSPRYYRYYMYHAPWNLYCRILKTCWFL